MFSFVSQLQGKSDSHKTIQCYGLMLRTPMSPTTLYIRYDEELALADAREREVKSRTGHRGKLKTEPRKPVSWK